jgi:hypothetical protein
MPTPPASFSLVALCVWSSSYRNTSSKIPRIGPADCPIRCGTKARLESFPVKEVIIAGPRIDLSFTHLTIEATGFPIRALLLRGLVASTARLAAKYNRGLSPVAHLAMMHSERSVFQSVSLLRFCSAHRKTCSNRLCISPVCLPIRCGISAA